MSHESGERRSAPTPSFLCEMKDKYSPSKAYAFNLEKAEATERESKDKLARTLAKEPPRSQRQLQTLHSAQTQTLIKLKEAMDGPGFPRTTPRPFQRTDDVNAFEPLLMEYLEAGGDIEATASFQDYFGHNIGLDHWTLLRVATSAWVKAPNCMRLLLKHGSNPLGRDSTGRLVITEALATARHGDWEPWNILTKEATKIHPTLSSIPDADIQAAKLCEVTECLIKHLRKAKMGITPSETRELFHQAWTDGFDIDKRHYDGISDVHSNFGEMYLIPLSKLLECDTLPLPTHPAVLPLSQWMITNASSKESRRRQSKIVFVSHRWLRPKEAHPDDKLNSKLHRICQAGLDYCARTRIQVEDIETEKSSSTSMSLDPEDCYLWIDYCCIDQTDIGIKTRSIQALPFYILLSDTFLYLDHQDYLHRAWCMLELLFGSAMATKTSDFLFAMYSTDDHLVCHDDSTSNDDSGVIQFPRCNPCNGGVTDARDMDFIRPLTWFAEDLYVWL